MMVRKSVLGMISNLEWNIFTQRRKPFWSCDTYSYLPTDLL